MRGTGTRLGSQRHAGKGRDLNNGKLSAVVHQLWYITCGVLIICGFTQV